MCLYPTIVDNPRYKPNKKNGGFPPKASRNEKKVVAIGCGVCMECMKQRANGWRVRLMEEIKTNKNGKFVTLTFNKESLEHLKNITESNDENHIATIAVRLFLERWRAKYGKSVRHWLVTEKGHTGTKRIHLHGIIWTDKDINERWGYGFVHEGKYVNEKTINYIVKYVMKQDKDNREFKAKILTSKGIGSNYINTYNAKKNKYKGERTEETYKLKNGGKTALPQYYRNKIYTEDEKEDLWMQKIDKNKRYVNGEEVDVSSKEGIKEYGKMLENAQRLNCRSGFKSKYEWDKEKYNKKHENMKINEEMFGI